MKPRLLLLLFLAAPAAALTRPIDPMPGEDSTVMRCHVSSITIHSGAIANATSDAASGDFRSLASSSLLLPADGSGYSRSPEEEFSAGNWFAASVDIVFPNAEQSHYRPNPLLRLGVSYLEVASLTDYYSLYRETPADTFFSSSTGQVLYGDSVISSYYDMEYRSAQFLIDASLLFRTNPEARWLLYAGVGLQAGLSFNARTEIRHGQSANLLLTSADGSTHYGVAYHESEDYTSELIHNKSGFAFGGYLPLGVSFRMGNNSEFWKRLHLFIEMRPGLSVVSIPELRTRVQAVYVSSFGLRVAVD